MTHLRQAMLEERQRRNYVKTTVHYYIQAVTRFAKHFRGLPTNSIRAAVDVTGGDLLCLRASPQDRGTITATVVRDARPDPSTHSSVTV